MVFHVYENVVNPLNTKLKLLSLKDPIRTAQWTLHLGYKNQSIDVI